MNYTSFKPPLDTALETGAPVIVALDGRTPDYVCVRLRMTLHFLKHVHPKYDSLCVSLAHTPGSVVVGPRAILKKRKPLSATPTSQANGLHIENPSPEIVVALCTLHAHRILTTPTLVVSAEDLCALEGRFDITVKKMSDNTYELK